MGALPAPRQRHVSSATSAPRQHRHVSTATCHLLLTMLRRRLVVHYPLASLLTRQTHSQTRPMHACPLWPSLAPPRSLTAAACAGGGVHNAPVRDEKGALKKYRVDQFNKEGWRGGSLEGAWRGRSAAWLPGWS